MQAMYSSNQAADPMQLKQSIRDIIQLQRDYQLSDELFWEVFNTRVLLNEHIDVETFVAGINDPVAKA